MKFRKDLLFLYLLPLPAYSFGYLGADYSYILVIAGVILFCAVAGPIIAANQKKPKNAFSFLLLPTFLIGLWLVYKAVNFYGLYSRSGEIKDQFLVFFSLGAIFMISSSWVYFKRRKRIKRIKGLV